MENVEKLASLLKTEPEVVKEALSDETGEKLGGLVDKFSSEAQIFTGDELTRKLDNHAKDYLDKIAKDGQPIPKDLYNRVKGNAFEKFEKELAKKHEVEDWDGLEDLYAKILVNEFLSRH